MLLFLVIVLLSVILAYPYASAAILKFRMLRRLIRVSRSAGYRVHKLKPAACLSPNRSASYDLLIGKEGRIFAIKLWSAYHRRRTLLLRETGRVSERWRTSEPLRVRRKAATSVMESRPRSVPRTKLPESVAKKKGLQRILLVYPSYSEIRVIRGERELRLSSGDGIFDKRLLTPTALESLLTEKGETDKFSENGSCFDGKNRFCYDFVSK